MFPLEFKERMEDMLGRDYPAFENALRGESYHGLRINPLKTGKEEFLKKCPFSLQPIAWEENGFYYDGKDTPGKHPYHEAGVYYIQEPSAMAPAGYLDVKPGERVLDLCAAPGGKTTQLGAAMKGRGILFCNEIHPARAKILSENVERMGIKNAIVLNESPKRLADEFAEFFDKILVDAPCSGEGMFRKNQTALLEWSPSNVEACAIRQDEILDHAAEMLSPAGSLVYSTCTFAPMENEGSISRFLKRHPEFSVVKVEKYSGMESGNPGWIEDGAKETEGTLRLFPHKIKGEGHYIAVLEKSGGGRMADFRGKREAGVPEKSLPLYLDFARENLKERPEGVYVNFGEQLYLLPKDSPSLKGLKVLRPGLHLGTNKKNRFEPSHALALSMKNQDAMHTLDFSRDSREIREYLKGNTLPAAGEGGWYLVTVDGYSMGWGKLTGQILKNHYPKGLRK